MVFQAFESFRSVFRSCRMGNAALLLLLGFLPVLTGCRADRVAVNPNDPKSPQYAYRLDELALLQMSADDIQELERQKRYGKIYDDFAGSDFKAGTSRRRFLIMANCVETYLGGVQEFDRGNTGFKRSFVRISSKKRRAMDILRREVQRDHGPIVEQLVFTGNGINFKLNSIYWFARDKSFLQCIADSARLEAETSPSTELESSPDSNPPKPDGESAQPATTTQQNTPASPPAGVEKKPSGETARAGAAAGPPPESEHAAPTTKPSARPNLERQKPPTPGVQPPKHSEGADADAPALRGKTPEHHSANPPTPAMPLDLVAPPRNEPPPNATPPTPH